MSPEEALALIRREEEEKVRALVKAREKYHDLDEESRDDYQFLWKLDRIVKKSTIPEEVLDQEGMVWIRVRAEMRASDERVRAKAFEVCTDEYEFCGLVIGGLPNFRRE